MFFSYLFLFSSIGLFLFYLHVAHSLFLPSKSSYKNTTAIINDASITTYHVNDGEFGDEGTTYETSVSYTYEVDGVVYKSNKLYKAVDTYGNNNSKGLEYHLKSNNIIKGASVEIFYDALNPKNAFILESPPGNGISILFMSIIFGTISFLSFLFVK